MKTVRVNTKNPYNIYIGKDSLCNLPQILNKENIKGKIAIVTDKNVASYYLLKLENILKEKGFSYCSIVIKGGEENKNIDTVCEIYNKLNEFEIKRQDVIVALGGGVVGDIAGFVSATYLRGIKYIQIPTSLLAFVDSSIGGKTGVDLPCGKNLVGAFKQPLFVLIDYNFLDTLPKIQIASGMAEVIKCGFIRDKSLVDDLINSNDFKEDLPLFIEKAINVKREVVEIDEFEKNERMLLNFGHTMGHAIEKYMNYKNITHGQAVAFGMLMISENEKIYKRLYDILVKYNLDTKCDIKRSEILKLIRNDKKSVRDGINLIVVKEEGKGEIIKYSYEKIGELYG